MRRLRWGKRLLLLAGAVSVVALSASTVGSAASEIVVPEFNTAPTIDGNAAEAEWAGAAPIAMTFWANSVPRSGTIYVGYDSTYLYIGLRTVDPTSNPAYPWPPYPGRMNSLDAWFDNDADGLMEVPDDRIITHFTGPSDFHYDPSYYPWGGWVADFLKPGGTSDSQGLGAFDAGTNLVTYEYRQPLCSGDPYDFCLEPGDTIGVVWNFQAGNGDVTYNATSGEYQPSWPLDASLWPKLTLEQNDPQALVAELIATIEGYPLDKLGLSLTDKLRTVARMLSQDKPSQASENLESFLREVTAQRGKGLTEEQANELTSEAERIQALISG